jgi:hypothetical protein
MVSIRTVSAAPTPEPETLRIRANGACGNRAECLRAPCDSAIP